MSLSSGESHLRSEQEKRTLSLQVQCWQSPSAWYRKKKPFQLCTSLVRVSPGGLMCCQSLTWRTQSGPSVTGWLIHPTLPGNIQMQNGFLGKSKSSRRFQLSSPQSKYRRYWFPRIFSPNPTLPNTVLWSLRISLNQKQGTKQLGFSMLLPPVCRWEMQKPSRPNTTMLLICENREENRKARGAGWKLSVYSPSCAAPCISLLLTAPKHLPIVH